MNAIRRLGFLFVFLALFAGNTYAQYAPIPNEPSGSGCPGDVTQCSAYKVRQDINNRFGGTVPIAPSYTTATITATGTIAPTVFGYCKAGLCVRQHNRAHCLGCPYLVPHHDNLWKVARLQQMYRAQREFLDADGNWVDAKQARRALHDLDDLATVMRIQQQARRDGGDIPLVDRLAVGGPRQEEAGE